jgi:hypothetical protein
MRTENESSRIVEADTETRPGFRMQDIVAKSIIGSRPKRVDKQLVRIKKELERFEGIVDNLKMFLRMKPKERKLVSGIIDMWLDKIK